MRRRLQRTTRRGYYWEENKSMISNHKAKLLGGDTNLRRKRKILWGGRSIAASAFGKIRKLFVHVNSSLSSDSGLRGGIREVKWVSLWRGGLTSWSQIGAKIQESSSNKWQRRMSLFYLLASSNQELLSVATPANCKSNLTKSCFSKARSNGSISSNVLIPQFPGPPDFSSVGLWAQRRRNKRRATYECFSTQ